MRISSKRRRSRPKPLPSEALEMGDYEGCQLGKFHYRGIRATCGKPMVCSIGGVRICAHHKKILDEIIAESWSEESAA